MLVYRGKNAYLSCISFSPDATTAVYEVIRPEKKPATLSMSAMSRTSTARIRRLMRKDVHGVMVCASHQPRKPRRRRSTLRQLRVARHHGQPERPRRRHESAHMGRESGVRGVDGHDGRNQLHEADFGASSGEILATFRYHGFSSKRRHRQKRDGESTACMDVCMPRLANEARVLEWICLLL